MRRRAFLAALGGAVAMPVSARAQDRPRLPRIGVLLPATPDDSEYPSLVVAFLQGLQQAGWTDRRNVRIEIRWGGGSADTLRKHAAELIALAPDVIMAAGASAAGPVLQATRTIPVVFTIVPDPIGAGFVETLAKPGGNATGFTSFEYGIGGKWLELLRELSPNVNRAGVLRDAATTAGVGQWSAIQTSAAALGMQASPINLRDVAELDRSVTDFARTPNGGLVVTSSGLAITLRDAIVAQAARHKLPTVYYSRGFVTAGGMASYGSDRLEQFRSAASYVDRILKGEKPSDLPVQAATKYETVINLKTAKALGLAVPTTLLARADEVIE